ACKFTASLQFEALRTQFPGLFLAARTYAPWYSGQHVLATGVEGSDGVQRVRARRLVFDPDFILLSFKGVEGFIVRIGTRLRLERLGIADVGSDAVIEVIDDAH